MSVFGRIVDRLLPAAYLKALQGMRSNQLARALNSQKDEESDTHASGHLNVPHYWAPFYHNRDWRGVVVPRYAAKLIWFRDKKDDPRLTGGQSPVSKSEERRLTKEQLKTWSRKNREVITAYCRTTGKKRRDLRAGDYAQMNLPMIVADASPRDGNLQKVEQNPFFSDAPGGGMAGFDNEAKAIVREELYKDMEQELRSRGLKQAKVVLNLRVR